jgi:mannose-1-phosphate guanylyltransferase
MKALILAGGSGTRLWPISRKGKPKQFQSLTGNRTMLQDTIARLDFLKPQDIFISTNEKYLKTVKEQSRNVVPVKNIIVEPALRDTAPCLGLAAVYLAAQDPHAVMAVIYADHLIKNRKELAAKLKAAEKLALKENTLNIIEVKAQFPNVNLGYVKIGKKTGTIDGTGIYAFEGFREKPDLATARKFQKSGKYLWNTGLYVWRTDTLLEQYGKFQPATYANLKKISAAIGTKEETAVLKKYYPLCEKISVDYGIMEKVDPRLVRIIPADLGWSDVGTWESIFEELAAGARGNLVKGVHLDIDSSGSLIYGNGKKTVATIGVRDLVIVDTDDALLVCPLNRSQDVKKLVEIMKKSSKYKKLL